VASPSVFTSALVEGLRTGAADFDHDGYVSADDAYDYAYRKVITSKVGQTPQRSMSTGEGTLLLARNPAGLTITPAALTEDLRAALDSSSPHVRVGAVNALGDWLTGPDPARALAAEQVLQRVAAEDGPVVAAAARARLADVADVAAAEPPAARADQPGEPDTARPAAAPAPSQARREEARQQARPAATAPHDQPAATATATAPEPAVARGRPAWFVFTGFGVLLITLCIVGAIILLTPATKAPSWAIVALSGLGIVVALGGVRDYPAVASMVIWSLAWSATYFSTLIAGWDNPHVTQVLMVECIVAACGEVVLWLWIINRPRNPFVSSFMIPFTAALILASVALYQKTLPSPTWDATSALTFVAVLAAIPALLTMARIARAHRPAHA
jgi:hypothetical protein